VRSQSIRRAGLLLIAVFAAVAYAAPAGAADRAYSTAFAWQSDPTDGYAGWLFQEYDSTGPVAPGRYSGRTGGVPTYGRGLTITPTGNGGVYPDQASGRFTYRTPGASPATQVSVRKVIYSGVTQKVADRQGVRLRLGDGTSNATDDLNTDGNTRTNATVTLPGMGFGPASSEISAWMFSEPCQPTTTTTCRTVDPANGGVNHVGAAELSLLDHEAPTITASGPAYEQRGRWVAGTPAGVTVQAIDAGSGVRSYTLKSTGPGGSRTVINRSITCDLKHTGTSSQQCPLSPAASIRDRGAIGALPTGITTFTAAARDLSGQVSRMLRWNVKVDRRAPTRPVAGKLTRLDGKFVVAPSDRLVVPVTSSDAHSGVLGISASVVDKNGPRTIEADLPCKPSSSQCQHLAKGNVVIDVGLLPEGTSSVTLRSTDLVGNTTAGRPVRLRIDRSAPNAVKLELEPARFPRFVTWRKPSDPGGSGVVSYEYRVTGPNARKGTFQTVRGGPRLPVASYSDRSVVEVRAVDAVGNRGEVTSATVRRPITSLSRRPGPVKLVSGGGAQADQLAKAFKLSQVDNDVAVLERKLGLSVATESRTARALRLGVRATTKVLRKAFSKAGIVGVIGDVLLNPAPISCAQSGYFRRLHLPAGKVYAYAASTLRIQPEDRVATNRALRMLLDERDIYRGEKRAAKGDDCEPEMSAGLEIAERLIKILEGRQRVVDAQLFPEVDAPVQPIKKGGGSVRYGVLDQGRATVAIARINRNADNAGTDCKRKPPGYRDGLDNSSHLLAKSLGGRGVRVNCVSTSKDFNQQIMREPERLAQSLIRSKPYIVLYDVIPIYASGSVRPVAIHVRVTSVDADPKKRDIVRFDKRLGPTGATPPQADPDV